MLIVFPDELLDNPDCYTIEYGKGLVPTATATPEEIEAIERYRKVMERAKLFSMEKK